MKLMHLVEVFLPLDRGNGTEISEAEIKAEVDRLAGEFGGATAFTRAPADGLWRDEGQVTRDRIVIVEVMVDRLDAAWWASYRGELETRFDQKEILIRATPSQVV